MGLTTIVKSAGLVWRMVAPYTEQRRFEHRRDELQREWLADVMAQVDRVEQRFHELHARLTAFEERNFASTFIRMTPEALGALSHDHRELFAAAVANVLRPDFSVEMKSRILRAIEQLEPGDIRYLHRIANATDIGSLVGRGGLRAAATNEANVRAQEAVFREDALAAALCTSNGGQLTALGKELLRYLDQWLESTSHGPGKE